MTGIVFGTWDLLHAGHLHLLRQCKQKCDYLIVGLHVDPSLERKNKNKPIESVFERQFRLLSTKYVNEVIVYETEKDLANILKVRKPSVRFLGSDYSNLTPLGISKRITEPDLVGIEYIDSIDIHTTDIRDKITGKK